MAIQEVGNRLYHIIEQRRESLCRFVQRVSFSAILMHTCKWNLTIENTNILLYIVTAFWWWGGGERQGKEPLNVKVIQVSKQHEVHVCCPRYKNPCLFVILQNIAAYAI